MKDSLLPKYWMSFMCAISVLVVLMAILQLFFPFIRWIEFGVFGFQLSMFCFLRFKYLSKSAIQKRNTVDRANRIKENVK